MIILNLDHLNDVEVDKKYYVKISKLSKAEKFKPRELVENSHVINLKRLDHLISIVTLYSRIFFNKDVFRLKSISETLENERDANMIG